jgi:hypothetical protein
MVQSSDSRILARQSIKMAERINMSRTVPAPSVPCTSISPHVYICIKPAMELPILVWTVDDILVKSITMVNQICQIRSNIGFLRESTSKYNSVTCICVFIVNRFKSIYVSSLGNEVVLLYAKRLLGTCFAIYNEQV